MASQIIFVIASLCLWHQGSAQSSSSAVTVAATPSLQLQSASVNATPALQSSDMMSSTSSKFVVPMIVLTNQPVQAASTSAMAPGSSAAASAAVANTVSAAAISPTSSAGSGTPASSVIVAAWNAWVNQNCKAMCCGGLASPTKYQENRTCNHVNTMYCPSDAYARNLTRDKDCPTCVNGDCNLTPPGNDAPNEKPWTVLLMSVFMVALGFVFAN